MPTEIVYENEQIIVRYNGDAMPPQDAYDFFRENSFSSREIPIFTANSVKQHREMHKIHDEIWKIFDEKLGKKQR